MKKPTIAFDIDDVLAINAEAFVNFSNERWGTNLKPDDYSEHWAEMWSLDHNQAEKRRDLIIKEKLFTSYSFFKDAKEILDGLKEKYDLVVVSSRSNVIQKDTIDWLEAGFKDIFSAIHFAKIWDDPKTHVLKKLKLTKTEICREIGADYLVDDQPKHCLDAARAGIKTVLFGDYAWNKNTKLNKNMSRAKNWQEIRVYFDEQAKSRV